MTIKECIDIVDNIKPNQYTVKDKVMWLSFLDEIIINDVLKTHEGYDRRYDLFEGYSEDKLSVTLIVPSPYDRLYTAYLKMRIDGENGETAKYNNSQALYDTYYMEYRKQYNKTHMPLNSANKRKAETPVKHTVGLSDAEYENIKRDLYNLLSNELGELVSPDKLYDIVTSYAQNNVEMLKGRDGYTPKKGVDYFTEDEIDDIKNDATPKKGVDYWTKADKAEIDAHIDEQYAIVKSDVDGLKKQINEEAHFRGYLSTNAKIRALKATPNDFAYSAESGTKWLYDEVSGWQDTGTPVPDQLTPASNATPLINGEASPGESEEYARGDHRHPTDTTRLSVEAFNAFKADLETGLDNIIAKQNELIGGGSE